MVPLTGYDSSGDNDGNVVERYSYTPYGEFIVLSGGATELGNVLPTFTVGNPFAHQGRPRARKGGRLSNAIFCLAASER